MKKKKPVEYPWYRDPLTPEQVGEVLHRIRLRNDERLRQILGHTRNWWKTA